MPLLLTLEKVTSVKVEAIMQKDGLFIPMNHILAKIPAQRIMVNIEILEPEGDAVSDVLDMLIGICETGISDAAEHHDARIYGRHISP